MIACSVQQFSVFDCFVKELPNIVFLTIGTNNFGIVKKPRLIREALWYGIDIDLIHLGFQLGQLCIQINNFLFLELSWSLDLILEQNVGVIDKWDLAHLVQNVFFLFLVLFFECVDFFLQLCNQLILLFAFDFKLSSKFLNTILKIGVDKILAVDLFFLKSFHSEDLGLMLALH